MISAKAQFERYYIFSTGVSLKRIFQNRKEELTMEKYEELEMEIIEFESEDVITTSVQLPVVG